MERTAVVNGQVFRHRETDTGADLPHWYCRESGETAYEGSHPLLYAALCEIEKGAALYPYVSCWMAMEGCEPCEGWVDPDEEE